MGAKADRARHSSAKSGSEASASSEASSSRSASPAADHADNQDPASGSVSGSDDGVDFESDAGADSEDEKSAHQPKVDAEKARTKLHHVAKTLRATAKKTKTFELQKLVKKLKGLQKKASLSDQAKLAEAELEALKSIDINLLAGRALVTKMVKAKLLPRPAELDAASNSAYLYLPLVRAEALLGEAVLSDPVTADGDRALERAKAKITSSKVLADEVGKFVDELKKLAGIEPIAAKKNGVEVDIKGKGKAVDLDSDDEEDDEGREWSGSDGDSDSDEELVRAGTEDSDAEDDDADEEELMRVGKQKLAALGDLSQWDDMIGSDSGAESESEEKEPRKASKRSARDSDDSSDDSDRDTSASDDESDDSDRDSASDSDSDSDSSDSESSSSGARSKKRKATRKDRSSKRARHSSSPSSSTFLPSLATGFIAGRSDDEWSDAEADLADRDLSELKGGKKERKNRMGQRARKALYEKKYGKNANHIKMREERKQAKLARPERPAAAASGRQRPPAFQAPAKRDGGWGGQVAPLPKQPKRPFVPRSQPSAPIQTPASTKTNAAPAKPTPSQEMHPSWIAKQKQKELMAQVKPEGKKIVFD